MTDVAAVPGAEAVSAEWIRVRGLVQGVGFRPTVWRLARQRGLRGSVANDGQGVNIHVCGSAASITDFVQNLLSQAPPLARIEHVERQRTASMPPDTEFRIVPSRATAVHTGIVPDAATCRDCRREIAAPGARRHRYPFTNCTHCGPRLSIIEAIPYDRGATTMRSFRLCPACDAEYHDPADRRFHAQPIACPACGPRAWLERIDGGVDAVAGRDDLEVARALLLRGGIVAIKGLGGFQLACDATNDRAVARLRRGKRRERKPFALMASDLGIVRRYCAVTPQEEALLHSPAAPIVIMPMAARGDRVAADVAPGIGTLGVMLPNTPLHHLILGGMDRSIVLTSGNLSDEPQCVANGEALARLGGIADYVLLHDRDIAWRIDDSVVRVMAGAPRILRRARGHAPAPLPLPAGFALAPPVLAMGGELKNTFCLLREGQAILSHHMGDLENALTLADYTRSIERYCALFDHAPGVIAVDRHPEYISTKLGRERAARAGLALVEVQHHHAHVAACMAENGVPLDSGPVLGIALDGLGFGLDGTLWGGEFLLADYRSFQRLATFKPVAMPGGARAIHEPWRNTYAHLASGMGWARFAENHAGTGLHDFLAAKPRALLDGMISRHVNSPLASSCGRLFDAVAAAAGLCREQAQYEGQAAVELEALVDADALRDEGDRLAYEFAIARHPPGDLPCIEPLPMWEALLADIGRGEPVPVIAARFHKGLAIALARMIGVLRAEAGAAGVATIALSGGVFQNKVLLEQVTERLERLEVRVLSHRQVPANDGGLALGQAAIAAAGALAGRPGS